MVIGRGATCANRTRASSSNVAAPLRSSGRAGAAAARRESARRAFRLAPLMRYPIAALDAADRVEPAIAGDVGRLRRPRRNRSRARDDEHQFAVIGLRFVVRSVGQQSLENRRVPPGVSSRSVSTKCQNVAAMPMIGCPEWAAASAAWSFLMRNGESAWRPRSVRRCSMPGTGVGKRDYTRLAHPKSPRKMQAVLTLPQKSGANSTFGR